MDPSVIAAITGALTVLSAEVAKGAAGEAGKNAWKKITGLLGSKSSEALDTAQAAITHQLEINLETTQQLLELLKSSNSVSVGRLVGSITAEKVVIANHIGKVNM